MVKLNCRFGAGVTRVTRIYLFRLQKLGKSIVNDKIPGSIPGSGIFVLPILMMIAKPKHFN